MTIELELCCGTVRQAGLAQLIEVAGDAGFQAITVNPEMVAEAAIGAAELRRRLADAGVRISNIDGFGSGLPGLPGPAEIERYRSFGGRDVRRTFLTPEDDFYRTAELTGGDSINLVHFGGDPETPLDAIAEAAKAIARRAAGHGLRIVVEFLPRTGVASIDAAARLVELVGEPNFEIMFDTRHLARTGGTAEDAARHATLVGGVQISDLFWETREDPNRLLPGDGELQLAAMIAPIRIARPDVPIGIEVFNDRLFAMPAADAAVVAGASLRKLIEQGAVAAA